MSASISGLIAVAACCACTSDLPSHSGDGLVTTGDASPGEGIGFIDGNADSVDGPIRSDGLLDVGVDIDGDITVSTSCQQDPGPEGIVSLEAECFHTRVSQGGHIWAYNGIADHSGLAAMRAIPNIDAVNGPNEVDNSPRMDYVVNFVKTGTHYIWIRGLAYNDSDDSCHAGFDGNALSTTVNVTNFGDLSETFLIGEWHWSTTNNDDARLTIVVTTPGEHTLNLWMREDGFFADKLVLTTSEDYEPDEVNDGLGPEACRCPLCGNGTLDPNEECESPFDECCDTALCQHEEDGTGCTNGVCQEGACVAGNDG